MKIKVGIIQSEVSGDKEKDLETMKKNVAELAGQGCEVVVLPEMFCCPYEKGSFAKYAESKNGRIWNALKDAAQYNRVTLVGGSFPLAENGKIYNACFVFDAQGNEIALHRKIHLFDVDIKGGVKFCESAELAAGDTATVFDTAYGRFGVCICYDWRFPELAMLMREKGADCVFVPAAFNTTTGPLHWETLFRGRSIDNQFFSIGVSPARSETSSYKAYGHSIAVSPWGRVITELDEKPQNTIVVLDLDEIAAVREQLPVFKHRKAFR